MFDTFAKNTLGPLILRCGLAVIFVYHGLGKVNAETDWGATWAQKMPDPPHATVQMAVAWGELVGGIALGLGLLTRLAALGIAAIMAGAIATIHWEHGFPLPHGFEYNFAIIVMCAAILVMGPGNMAIDRVVFRRRGAT
jgi:putative oxidoreductase